jgi:tetratricopeptide (TPR) repeat protein
MDKIFEDLSSRLGLRIDGIAPHTVITKKAPGDPDLIEAGMTLDLRGRLPENLASDKKIWAGVAEAIAKFKEVSEAPIELFPVALYIEECGSPIFLLLSSPESFDVWQSASQAWRRLQRALAAVERDDPALAKLLIGRTIIARVGELSGELYGSNWRYMVQKGWPPPASVIEPFELQLRGGSSPITRGSLVMGMVLERAGEWDEGARELEQCVSDKAFYDFDKNFQAKTLNRLGVCYINLKLFHLAIARFENMLSRGESQALAHYNLAYVYDEIGRQSSERSAFQKAEAHLREATRLQPDYEDAWYNLCCALAIMGKRAEVGNLLLNAKIDRGKLMTQLQRDPDWQAPPRTLVEGTRDVASDGNPSYEHDIAISFAGEDRQYAEQLAVLLRGQGLRVFYDRYEEANLWGKDLYVHLADVYQNKAQYCVVFVSRHYGAKLWTKHEFQEAVARAFRDSKEYILPIKLDDTVIPGLRETIGYVSLRNKSIDQIADLLLRKIRDRA